MTNLMKFEEAPEGSKKPMPDTLESKAAPALAEVQHAEHH